MPKVIDAARATIHDGVLWRTCPACNQLAAMAPEALLCDACANHRANEERDGSWTR